MVASEDQRAPVVAVVGLEMGLEALALLTPDRALPVLVLMAAAVVVAKVDLTLEPEPLVATGI